MTQEFHISLTPVGQENYLVRTERVAQGVPLAEEQLVLPVQDWLAQAQQLMSDPILRVLQAPQSLKPATNGATNLRQDSQAAQNLMEFGQHLYAALFQRTLRDSWVTAQGIALHRGEVLRLRLGLKGTRLPRLPWEVMHNVELTPVLAHHTQPPRAKSRPLATGTEIVLSRYQAGVEFLGANLPPTLEPGQPLRLLMAIAAPTDQARLNLHQEAQHLQQELTARIQTPNDSAFPREIEITILEQPGREQLTQALEQGHYHVFHYAGHSNLGEAGGSLYLVNERTGLTESLNGDDLAGLLVNNGVLMAVFNSCQGAYTAASNPLNSSGRSLTEALVDRGIPAVVAMAENIPDDVALMLSRLFYRNLRQGYPIDLSMSRARQGLISSYSSQQLYWALPVLYLHPGFDGYFVAGDRTINNPADQLLLSLPSFDNPPTVPQDEFDFPSSPAASSAEERDRAMISDAVLNDEDADWFNDLDDLDDLEHPVLVDDADLSYDDDPPDVSELIQQLSQPQFDQEDFVRADEYEVLLPEGPNPLAELYDSLPTRPQPHSGQKASSATNGSAAQSDAASAITVANRGGLVNSTRAPLSLPVADANLAPVATPPGPDPSTPSDRSTPRRQWLWQTVAIAGTGLIAAIAVLALLPYLRSGEGGPGGIPSPTLTASPDPETARVSERTQEAIAQLQRGNLEEGLPAVTELLDNGNLSQASTALGAIPPAQLARPEVNFLRGRLSWQSIQQGSDDHDLAGVIRHWSEALEDDPKNLNYHTALGFAYYANGDLQEALETWCQGLTAAPPTASGGSGDLASRVNGIACPLSTQPPSDFKVLNTYAGIALVLSRLNFEDSAGQTNLLEQAVQIQRAVTTVAPSYLDSQTLAQNQNWLWSEMAILEWQELIALEF